MEQEQLESLAEQYKNGRVTKEQAREALDSAVQKAVPKAMAWMKACLFWIFVVAIVLPSLGVTAVLFAFAYSLVK